MTLSARAASAGVRMSFGEVGVVVKLVGYVAWYESFDPEGTWKMCAPQREHDEWDFPKDVFVLSRPTPATTVTGGPSLPITPTIWGGAPARLQDGQWQNPSKTLTPATENFTPPQKQEPFSSIAAGLGGASVSSRRTYMVPCADGQCELWKLRHFARVTRASNPRFSAEIEPRLRFDS